MNLLQIFCCNDDDPASVNLGKLLKDINERTRKMAANLDQLIDKVSKQSTQLDSLNTFVEGIQAEIKKLKLNQADQEKIDALFDKVSENDAKIAEAFTENTPEAPAQNPTPTPVPPVESI